MSRDIRVGVIGTSWFTKNFHLAPLKSHPHAEIAAICARSREHAQETAQQYGISQVFTDYREMIEKANLDAVIIAAPDDLHYPMTMDALDTGLHVLCEKPLALNAKHAQAMCDRAEAAGIKHMVNFTWHWMPYAQYLRALLNQGYIGRHIVCNLTYVGSSGLKAQYNWRMDRQRANGVLGDLGPHMLELAMWYFGDIASVSAQLATFVPRPHPDGQPNDPANDCATLLVEFASGARGMIQLSDVVSCGDRGIEQQFVLSGDSGRLDVDMAGWGSAQGVVIRSLPRAEEPVSVLPIPDHYWEGVDRSKDFLSQIMELFTKRSIGPRLFIDSIMDDKFIPQNFQVALRVQKIIDAALESHEKGCRVAVA